MQQFEYKIPDHKYLCRLEEYQLITNWQTQRCVSSRNRLMLHNMKFVAKIASKYIKKYSHVSYPDLISYGNLGFYRAIDTFEISSGRRLGTYAVFWVKQAIQRGVEENESRIRLPANIHEVIRKKVSKKGKDAEPLTEEENVFMDNVRGKFNIDDRVGENRGEEGGMSLSEVYSYMNHNPEDLQDNVVIADEKNNAVKAALDGLDPTEQTVILQLFGLSGAEEMNLREVGDSLGVCHEQVRKIKMTSLEKLGKRLKQFK